MGKIILILLFVAAAVWGGMLISGHKPLSTIKYGGVMQISSFAFANNSNIPTKYTCDGESISPPLSFSGISPDAISLALVVEDVDAPNGTFTHWVVYNMPPRTSELGEGAAAPGRVAGNSAGTRTYVGPCPPSGEHRYYFKLYALNSMLPDGEIGNKAQLQEAMNSHILDQAELLGRYTKNN